jgi:hypothetical protein
MSNQRNLPRLITIGGSIATTIAGAIWLWRIGGHVSLDFSGQAVLLIGGALLGAGVGIMFFGTFIPITFAAISGEIRSIIILVLSPISSIVAYQLLWGGSGGNITISLIGAFAGFFIPLIAAGFIANLLDSFRN